MIRLEVNTNQKYDILLGHNIISNLKDYVDKNKQILIIMDDNIPVRYMESIKNSLDNNIYSFVIRHGENNKSFSNYQNILNYLLDLNFTRDDMIINLGGGVVSDLGGFIASTYKRGIKYINIPTTTLSMVDSSIGGKVAINYSGYKNVIGSFYEPYLVIIDIELLKTLDARNYYNGLVEALKMSLLDSKDFFELFKDLHQNLDDIIYKSLMFKKRIIEEDEKDLGIRRILNFGHTLGHAIEAKYINKIYHGEAVGYGMLPFIDNLNLRSQVQTILQKMNINIDEARYHNLKEYIKQDKKNNFEKDKLYVNVIKLKDIGNPYIEKIDIEQFN
ncbi:MAG: 3-dehydroquinate synthase family protein [Bacilli bacterium]|nr:3-dehydroquinate synthase family protein [Bacilli bacterium]